jgi:NTP pyrophosphatase (non-canonical NTP hydrolase)
MMKDIIRALEKNSDRLEAIKRKIGKEEVLAGLAEEAAELSQAALKYRRALNGINPTPVTCIVADENLQEELADTLLNAILAGVDTATVAENLYKKINRWCDRLEVDNEKRVRLFQED